MANLSVLVAASQEKIARYQKQLTPHDDIKIVTVTEFDQVHETLASPDFVFDVMVVDASLGNVPALLGKVQRQYRALLTILVDEGADFAMPGRAHDVTTNPFGKGDLVRRIKRLVEERRLETLRADALPPVRSFARQIRNAAPGESKREAAVAAVQQLGFDYAGFFAVDWSEPPRLTSSAQVGPPQATRMVPTQQTLAEAGLLGWVTNNGISRIVGLDDTPNHALVSKGVFASAVCVPVGMNLRFGVLLACRQQPNSISGQDVMMLELVAAQLAAALATESKRAR